MYRDFSENSKQELLGLVNQVENDKWSDFTDWVGDKWYAFEAWIGELNIQKYLNNVNEYHKKVIDKNNATTEAVNAIFSEVKSVDRMYRLGLYTVRTSLKRWLRYIEQMSEIVNPINGKFIPKYMDEELGGILLSQYTNFIQAYGISADFVYPKLIEFDATGLFIDSRDTSVDAFAVAYTSDWIKNLVSVLLGNPTFVKAAIGSTGVVGALVNTSDWLKHYVSIVCDNVDDANETMMRKSIESVISEVLVNKHNAEDFFDEYTKALMPEEVELEKKIIGLLIDTGKIYTKHELANLLKDERKRTNSDYLKWLCQTENLDFLNQLSDKISVTLGAYKDAVDTLDIASELLTKVFNDYTEDTKYLEAIKEALIDGGYDNKVVNDVIDKMLWEYKNQYISATVDGIEKLAEIGIDKGVDKLLPLLDIFIKTKDISSTMIGLEDTTDNLASIYATQQYSYGLVEKYEYYRQKINSGVYAQTDIEKCNTYFELARAAKLKEYSAIKEIIEKSLNSFTSNFHNVEDIQYTKEILEKVEVEIKRLESLSLPSNGKSNFSTEQNSGGMGGR